MTKINIVLITFILIGFSSFKLLYLQGSSISTNECEIGSLSLINCIVKIGVNCQDENGDFQIIQNGTVCINIAEFTSPSAANCDSIFDVGACIKYLADTIFTIFKIVFELILIILSFLLDVLILIAVYITLGLSPLPGAPFIINLIFIGPFILMNLIIIMNFITLVPIPGE